MTPDDSSAAGSGFYPGSTVIEQQVSIFLLGCRHAVSWRQFDDWFPRVRRLGWLPHPYLRSFPVTTPVCQDGRRFGPQLVLTSIAHAAMLGETWGDALGLEVPADWAATRALFRARLSPKQGQAKHVESLLLTRDAARCPWLGQSLTAGLPTRESIIFTVEWADLWLFDDATGMLALKVRLDTVISVEGVTRPPTLSDIGAFHRHLRDWHDPAVTVRRVAEPESECRFWEEVVFKGWLGTGEVDQPLLMLDAQAPQSVFDGGSRYCKLLTGVQVREIAAPDELAWSAPMADPLGQYPYHRHCRELQSGQIGNALLAYQAASLAGYPTYRNLLLFELATTSNEGAAGGHAGQRDWQYSMDYVRRILQEGQIDIWEYWQGLALRDVCAFVAWSDSVPLIKRGQLEAYYYPLYVHAYHLRYELDGITGRCVDHDLVETKKLREELRRFQTFRSRYWFREVTRDFQGVEVFHRMKRGLEVDALFETVSAEVKEVSEYIEGMADRGRQALVALAIAVVSPLYLWFNYAGDTVTSVYARAVDAHPLAALGVTVLVIIVFAALLIRTWTAWAPPIARKLQRVYAWLARERL